MTRWWAQERRWLVAAALALSTLLKVVVALSPSLGRLNSDQAVLYLTARQVEQGHLTPWFWGQEYGGSLLQSALGLVFTVTGAHLWMLPVAVGAMSTLVAVLTWRVGVALGFPEQGAAAAALIALGPPTWLFLGVASEGFYSVGLAASLGSLLLALKPLTGLRAAVLGLLVGLALWASPFSFLTTLPTAFVLLPVLRRRPALLLPVGAGTLLGSLPVLRVLADKGTLQPAQFHGTVPMSDRVEAAVTGTWSAAFTRFHPSAVPAWLVDRLAVVGLLVAVVAAAAALVRLARGRGDLPTAALLLPVLLWVPFHVHSYLPSDLPASRYALPVLPFLALWASRWLGDHRRALAVLGAWAAFTTVGLVQAADGLSTHVLHNRSYALLAAELESRGRTAVYAEYWVAYRLAAETDERVVADPPAMPRHADYASRAGQAPDTTVVVFAGQANDVALQKALAGVERVEVAQFAVFYAAGRRQLPGFAGTYDVDRP